MSLIERAEQILHMMPHFMGYHVGVGEVAAGVLLIALYIAYMLIIIRG